MCSSSSLSGIFFKYSNGFVDRFVILDVGEVVSIFKFPAKLRLGATLWSGTSSGMSTELKKSSSSSSKFEVCGAVFEG